MKSELATVKTGASIDVLPSMDEWSLLKDQAMCLMRSDFLPQSLKKPEQVIVVILTGRELGIGTMEALRGINVIQGRPAVSPQLMLALAYRTGEVQNFKVEDIKTGSVITACTATVQRKGGSSISVTFGKDEAQAMGLSGKDNYKKQPATMYRWRAVGAVLRLAFPDAISGLFTADELGANVVVDEAGGEKIIDAPGHVEKDATKKIETIHEKVVIETKTTVDVPKERVIESGHEEGGSGEGGEKSEEQGANTQAGETGSDSEHFFKTSTGTWKVRNSLSTTEGVPCPECGAPLLALQKRAHGGISTKCDGCGEWINKEGDHKKTTESDDKITEKTTVTKDKKKHDYIINSLKCVVSEYNFSTLEIRSIVKQKYGVESVQELSKQGDDQKLIDLTEYLAVLGEEKKNAAEAEANGGRPELEF